MITFSKEDYLKAIATVAAEGEDVIPATLARLLCLTRPSVTAAVKRLSKDGLVRVGKDGRVRLTSTGREIAHRTILRHHLIERMLTELFAMPWYAVHEEAKRLEHVVSPAFEEKLVEKLGKKSPCPHGNFPMQSAVDRRRKGLCLLNEAAVDGVYQIISVFECDRQLLEMLDREGMRPGAQIVLRSKNDDGTATLRIGNRLLRLGGPAAKKLWVKKA